MISFQLIFILKSLDVSFETKNFFLQRFGSKRILLFFGLVVFLLAGLFAVLHLTGTEIGSTDPLYFPPSSILTPLQIFSAWMILFLVRFYGIKDETEIRIKQEMVINWIVIDLGGHIYYLEWYPFALYW